MVGHQPEVHRVQTTCQQFALLRRLDVARQQCGTLPATDAQHTAECIAFARAFKVLGQGVQHLKQHTVPNPTLARLAALAWAVSQQRVFTLQRRPQARLRLHGQHRRSAPGVIAVAVAEHQHIE